VLSLLLQARVLVLLDEGSNLVFSFRQLVHVLGLELHDRQVEGVLGALDRTGQEEDHSHNLFVGGNLFLEGVLVLILLVVLVPIVDFLGAGKNFFRSVVDGLLHVFY